MPVDLQYLFPELTLVVFGCLVIFAGLAGASGRLLVALSILGLLIAADLTLPLVGLNTSSFYGMLVVDGFAVILKFLLLFSTVLVVLASTEYARRFRDLQAEYYALLLFSCAGMMLLSAAGELITIYLALETTSITLAVLAGFLKDERSTEAGLKFLLLSAVSSAVLLYGMAILIGLTGSTGIREIAAAAPTAFVQNRIPVLLATVLMLAGFGFKMAIVPFQMWVPDVYEGAPTPVTAFLSVASKAAGFAVVLRVFHTALGLQAIALDWSAIAAVLSALSMTVGNVVAIQQSNIKRMMGYSSIAQAGYLLVGVAVIPQAGPGAVLFFLVSYAVTNLGAFIAIIALSDRLGTERIDGYAGAWQRAPFLSMGLALCLLSLTGIPPTSGFFAKLFIFDAGVRNGLIWLVVVGVLNSVISAYYYVGVIRAVFLGVSESARPVRTPLTLGLALTLAVAGTFLLGVFPGPAMMAAGAAAASLVP